jgi:hypothetical protein
MVNRTLPEHAAGKRAAQHLLSRGLASYAEVAALAGRSRQIVRKWASQIDAETARREHLQKLWNDALAKHG